ncbi:MAG: molybdate ABC transporter substrate-binding protein [Armatimonadetes bacterium]|nr:molybdate ABC transporter substrate-binding protein [Armatimonadota bacterium]
MRKLWSIALLLSLAAGLHAGQVVRVFAAVSLRPLLSQLKFERLHAAFPDCKVEFVYGGSPMLVAQLQQGLPGDLLITADSVNMEKAITAGLVAGRAHELCRNRLMLAVRKEAVKTVTSIKDLAAPKIRIAIGQRSVPAGNYAWKAIDKAALVYGPKWRESVFHHVATEEPDVASVLAKVKFGAVDAGFVYATDILSANGSVIGIELEKRFAVTGHYFVAAVRRGKVGLARLLLDDLRSAETERELLKLGYNVAHR